MTSSWLASFVLIVVALGALALFGGAVWLLFSFLSHWDSWLDERAGGPVSRHAPASRAGLGTRS
jgi:hypothetical protein